MAKAWMSALVDAGKSRRVRGVEGFVVLTRWLEENADVMTEASHLSDAELAIESQKARVAATVESFRNSPDVAATIAAKFGLTADWAQSLWQ